MMRSHSCGELTEQQEGKEVELCGWLHIRRDHGGIIFLDLRDRYGITQIVCDPQHNKQVHRIAERCSRESVIQVKGKVRMRPKNMENAELITGKVEVLANALNILSQSDVPPLDIDTEKDASEELRLRYRYLDLRREKMKVLLQKRHQAAQAARAYFTKNNFLEIETPLLIRSTPEGARDYLVPSRVHPGKFYALPQSPQIYKQILMVAGVDRYFQLAKCLRDEDLRQDRQPEHTQMDFEMSFVDEEDIKECVEGLYKILMKAVRGEELSTPFPTLTYDEAMSTYGSDKPDIRFGMKLIDVTIESKQSTFNVFTAAEQVKCIVLEEEMSRKEIDELITWSQTEGAKGLAWMRVTEQGLESSISKFFSLEVQKTLIEKTKAQKNSTLFFVADNKNIVATVLGKLRLLLAKKFSLVNNNTFAFCWVNKFPIFEKNDEGGWNAQHHIFSKPYQECEEYIETAPEKVYGHLFDIVLNGVELGSGSLRVTNNVLQKRLLKVIGMNKEEAEKRFGFLTTAFQYGVPPHGGMGLGFDRVVALLCGYEDIREVIAFPKNKKAENPMDNCPTTVEDAQLKELHLESKAKTN